MQTFKQYLELFIDPVFDSLTSGQQTTAAAAGEFIGQVRDLLGPNIWAGRLTHEQQQAQASSPHMPPPSGGASSIPLCCTGWPPQFCTDLLCLHPVAILHALRVEYHV